MPPRNMFDTLCLAHNLGRIAVGRQNNLNLIRFLAASLVLITHSFVLATGNPALEPLRASLGITLGSIAVDVFFVASGFLIASSLEKSQSLRSFFVARFLRIYPALWVMLLLLALAMGPMVTALSMGKYFGAKDLYTYLLHGITLVRGVTHVLPGVFADVPYKGAVNGSLWTLPYEVRCYVVLALLYWASTALTGLSDKARKALLTTIAVLLIILVMALGMSLRKNYPGVYLGAIFFMGSALYAHRQSIKVSWLSVLLSMGLLVLLGTFESSRSLFHYAYPVLIGYVVLGLAYLPSGWLLHYNKLGDYSYGMYIYAFPIQQLIMFSLPGTTPWMLSALAFPATLLLAVCSWHAVEKPALGLKKKLQGSSTSAVIKPRHDAQHNAGG